LKLYARFRVPVLLALAILLASCGTGGGDAQDVDQGKKAEAGNRQTQGANHARKDESGEMPGMKGMDSGSGGMASGMLMKNGKYSDERFIDAMVPHHEGAVEMARVAVKNAEHPEIERLAEHIISNQEAEINELESIKESEYGTSKVPRHMSMGQMKDMGMMMNPQSLADKKPFDKAFIDNMIPHHQSAIEMAQVARDETDNPKIKELAAGIISAQKREISQMKQWRTQWYQKG
jgi:uncharacterized protein (DUF305 family)